MNHPPTDIERELHAVRSLRGLSIGDAFGQQFVGREGLIDRRVVPAGPWRFTDDTMMALSVFEVLRRCGRIDQEMLAKSFVRHYDYHRGYGPAMHGLLARIGEGIPWQHAAGELFAGHGSYGNGAAMRVTPLGAYFADEPVRAAEEAAMSAVVTHTHPEAVAGAIAVAVAAAIATQLAGHSPTPSRAEFLDQLLPYVPESEVRAGIRKARDMAPDASLRLAVSILGNGAQLSAQDTVPFALWCAGEHLRNFADALWLTVSGLGDRDTTCAIAGSIVICCAPPETIPDAWAESCEMLPAWALYE